LKNRTVGEICHRIGGLLVQGAADEVITSLAGLEQASPGSLTFYHNPKWRDKLSHTPASAVLVPTGTGPLPDVRAALVEVAYPQLAFHELAREVWERHLPSQAGIHPTACVAPTARVAPDAYIGPYCIIEDGAEIGSRTVLLGQVYIGAHSCIEAGVIIYPQVVVYHETKIGRRCILHSGAVVGADGYGFVQDDSGHSHKVYQIGNVVLEDDVEIGANTCIDRSAFAETRIGRGTKVDNLVQIAHNVRVGAHSLIAAQAGIAGSTELGEKCMLGGQVGIVGHIRLAERTQVGAQSGVSKTVDVPGSALRGSPASPLRTQLKQEAALRQLPTLLQRIAALEEKISELQARMP
jgi:UDP-3-O-[3-hydroxymyristoyl] glucosamine N-acyltransferase